MTKADKTDSYPKAEINVALSILQAGIYRKTASDSVYNKSDIDLRFPSLIGAAPSVLNTIVELSAALSHDSDYATTIQNQLNTKADKLNTYSKVDVNVAISSLQADIDNKLLINDGKFKIISSTNTF